MRRKPSASHWVNRPLSDENRPDSWVFLSGQQVLRMSSVKLSPGGLSITSRPGSWRKLTLSPLACTRSRVMSSPCSFSGCGGSDRLRSITSRLPTMVLAGSRSKVSSTLRIQ